MSQNRVKKILDELKVPVETRASFISALREQAAGKANAFTKWKYLPVDPYTFFTHEYYLNAGTSIYPTIMDELVEINSGKYDEIVLTGGIGSGKTSIAVWSQAYQLYVLSCLEQPQAEFGLDPSHEIVIIFQSLNATLAEELDYSRFKSALDRSRYFQEKFPHNKYLESQMEFPNRVIVKPVGGTETSAIGHNVIGGVIDEINFMARVERSKQASDGGVYDQAIELYNTIARRRKSRFLAGGKMPGLLCLVSSKKTPGQFTDRKEAEAKTNRRIYVYDKRVWDVKPNSFGGDKFIVFIGDMTRKPRILQPGEAIPLSDRHLVDSIPIEFRQEFEEDITKALRDIAGKATAAIHPFMPETERVVANFGKHKNLIDEQLIDFVKIRPGVRPSTIVNPQSPRFIHIDLALTGDSAGLVIGHVPRFVTVKRVEDTETLPVIHIDLALEIKAPKDGEIEFHNIRRLLYVIRKQGMNLKWVTLDSYQSADTMQVLRSAGFMVGYQSLDTTMVPYQFTKAALYDGRVPMPDHERLKTELITLERDFKRNKVDHNAHGSKDIADALAGVVYGLTMRKEIWLAHEVNPVLSPSVSQQLSQQRDEDVTTNHLHRRTS